LQVEYWLAREKVREVDNRYFFDVVFLDVVERLNAT
jgi:hypothetical protein